MFPYKELMCWTLFRVSELSNVLIKYSDWLLQVTWLVLTNQKALFQQKITVYNVQLI